MKDIIKQEEEKDLTIKKEDNENVISQKRTQKYNRKVNSQNQKLKT